MKPVQFCTGFIICAFPEVATAKEIYQIHFKKLNLLICGQFIIESIGKMYLDFFCSFV